MVRAVANVEETIRIDLKTVEGGFVVLKRLTYGQKLHRRQMMSNLRVEGGGKKNSLEGTMQLINAAATQFDFKNCIVDHNLDDERDVKLNLGNPVDISRLDPRVGEEIDNHINELNNFEEDEDDEGKD